MTASCSTLAHRKRPDDPAALSQAKARAFVWKYFDGICQRCGVDLKACKPGRAWVADHRIPLYFKPGCAEAFYPENLDLLCAEPCNKEKTAEDQAAIAKAKRIQAQNGLLQKKPSKKQQVLARLQARDRLVDHMRVFPPRREQKERAE